MTDAPATFADSANENILVGPEGQYYFSIHFWLFLFLFIVNIPSCLYYIYDFLIHAERRRALHSHLTLVLICINLFFNLTDVLFFLYFLHTFERLSSTREFRLFWGYVDWMVFYLQMLLFGWDCIERHILIFHDRLVATRMKRFLVHYLPPISITLYCSIYYTVVIFGSGCENVYPDDPAPSFYPCAFLQNNVLFMYDTVVHQLLSTYVIVLSCLFLLFRIVWQKYRVHWRIHWRQHRRMIIQLLSVAFPYLAMSTPYCVVNVLYLSGVPPNPLGDFIAYYSFFAYYSLALYPVICVASSSSASKRVGRFFRRHAAVRPVQENSTSLRTRAKTVARN